MTVVQEIYRLVDAGLSRQEIAQRLRVSRKLVEDVCSCKRGEYYLRLRRPVYCRGCRRTSYYDPCVYCAAMRERKRKLADQQKNTLSTQ